MHLLALASAAGPARAQTASPAEQPLLLFHDPDANQAAILNITAWFNSFLQGRRLDLRFQPVLDTASLETLARGPSSEVAIITSTYILRSPLPLEPILVPAANGEPFYRKILIDTGGGDPANLGNKTIAATLPAGGDHSALLKALASEGIQVKGAIFIPVSKDIDALLALSFGQVQAALVTPRSVEVMRRINPRGAASYRVLYETKPILRAPLCVIDGRATAEKRKRITDVLRDMKNDENGRKAMGGLGFDDWVPFKPGMLQR